MAAPQSAMERAVTALDCRVDRGVADVKGLGLGNIEM